MSKQMATNWLMSLRSDNLSTVESFSHKLKSSKITKVIAVASGKGGVGKTTISLSLGKQLTESGSKVLLIDCDYNLSNTAVKLGLPLNDNFYSLLSLEKTFEECIYKDGNLHLLSGCNGNADIFDNSFEHDKFIMDIINEHKSDYDFIILDCPAGLNRDNVNLTAYADHRFMIVNPDKSSLTDTYALIKILKQRYAINENHLIVNRVSKNSQYQKVVKSISETVSTFLNGRVKVLGLIAAVDQPMDEFDKNFMGVEKNSIEKYLINILNKFTDESTSHDFVLPQNLNQSSVGQVVSSTF